MPDCPELNFSSQFRLEYGGMARFIQFDGGKKQAEAKRAVIAIE
jgi:hypothetical protein